MKNAEEKSLMEQHRENMSKKITKNKHKKNKKKKSKHKKKKKRRRESSSSDSSEYVVFYVKFLTHHSLNLN